MDIPHRKRVEVAEKMRHVIMSVLGAPTVMPRESQCTSPRTTNMVQRNNNPIARVILVKVTQSAPEDRQMMNCTKQSEIPTVRLLVMSQVTVTMNRLRALLNKAQAPVHHPDTPQIVMTTIKARNQHLHPVAHAAVEANKGERVSSRVAMKQHQTPPQQRPANPQRANREKTFTLLTVK